MDVEAEAAADSASAMSPGDGVGAGAEVGEVLTPADGTFRKRRDNAIPPSLRVPPGRGSGGQPHQSRRRRVLLVPSPFRPRKRGFRRPKMRLVVIKKPMLTCVFSLIALRDSTATRTIE